MPELPDLSGYTGYIVAGVRYLLPLLMLWVLARCVRSMLRERYEPETWAYLVDLNGERHSVNHWECIVGRSGSCDVVLDAPSVSRVHASLQRDGNGYWTVSDLRSKGGTFVNGGEADLLDPVRDGDVLDFAGEELVFQEVGRDEREWLERRRTAPGRYVGPGVTLLILTLFQAFLTLEFTVTAEEEYLLPVCLAFLAIIVLEWFCYLVMRSVRRTGFEPETIAFLLSTLGMSVAASSTPDDMFRQVLFLCLGVALFFFLGWWLRDLRRVKAVRWLAALAAMGLLAVTVVLGEVRGGSGSWLNFGAFTVQPSELVKVLYIYTGAATLDRLFARRNLFVFIVFSAICVCALALMGDFGTALIFFATFLVIAFLRSGSFATVFLAVGGAAMAGFLVLSVKPYVAERFMTWEDVWDSGYQQTHAMSAAAQGGLFGRGAGEGSLVNITAADTDMVFAVLSEELGLIIAALAMFAVVFLALFTVRNAARGRSTFYVIAGCAAVSMMMVQMGLNIFGSLDILPFTGVTFPFVSKGGTSLIACWMLLAYVKATDTRRDASFVVSRDPKTPEPEYEEEYEEDEPADEPGGVQPGKEGA